MPLLARGYLNESVLDEVRHDVAFRIPRLSARPVYTAGNRAGVRSPTSVGPGCWQVVLAM